jgi:hypothetical protein
VVDDGTGGADLLYSIERVSLGDADDSFTIDERAVKLNIELDFGGGNNSVQVKDASPTPVEVLDEGVLRVNFSTLLENGSSAGASHQTITIDSGADAGGAVLLVNGRQIAGGAAFDFDLFDLFGGTRSVMVGTLDVPTRPPYTVDCGTSGISTSDRVQEWFSEHAKAYQDFIAALSSGGNLFSTLITASFMSILTADLTRLKSSFADMYTQQIIGTQGELYQLDNETFDADGRVTSADLTITLNPGMASAYTIEVNGWKQGDFGIRIENLAWRHGLDGGLNKNGQQDNWLGVSLETIRTQLATLGFDAMDSAGGGGGGIGARGANDPGIALAGNASANTLIGTAGLDNLYGDQGADSRRPRSAATPALVWVSTRIGFAASCRAKASTISCVLPQPAGAITSPRDISRRSMSAGAIFNPGQHAVHDASQAGIGVVICRPDDGPPRCFHGRDGFQPAEACGRIAEKRAATGAEAVKQHFDLKIAKRRRCVRDGRDMRLHQRAVLYLDGELQQLAAGPSGSAAKSSCSSARSPRQAKTWPPPARKVASAAAGAGLSLSRRMATRYPRDWSALARLKVSSPLPLTRVAPQAASDLSPAPVKCWSRPRMRPISLPPSHTTIEEASRAWACARIVPCTSPASLARVTMCSPPLFRTICS